MDTDKPDEALTLRVPKELKARVEELAIKSQRSNSFIVRDILADYFQRQDIEREIAARQPAKA